MSHVVKSDLGIDPRVVLHLAFKLVVDNLDWESIPGLVDALVELATKELDTHDGENQPEDKAHQQDVEDGWNSVHQGVDDDL